MVCCAFITAAVGVVLAVIVARPGDESTGVRIAPASYTPVVLEATQVTGYPEGQMPTPEFLGAHHDPI